MVKKASEISLKKSPSNTDIEKLADELSDRTYGEDKKKKNEMVRTSISLDRDLMNEVEDLALKNKRMKRDPKSFSAIVREALTSYLISNK
ncbi:hypothetical protein [Photobacterium carnosum]|uniref:hypothetical protein n=1 Tax=Photobacterium carnosum TaxID=2023717 RepID=UPI001E2BDFC1|nr:hypothetical protein [Photobacterium carnosum]MCD9496911.1 hypothetical protein [Photobacterium carnosum]